MNNNQFNLAAQHTKLGAQLLDAARGVLVAGEPCRHSMWRAGLDYTPSIHAQVRRAICRIRNIHTKRDRLPAGFRLVRCRHE